MRTNILQRIGLFILLITVLSVFSNCRILQKTKSEFTETQKTDVDLVSSASGSASVNSEFNEEQQSTYDLSNDKFSELFKLNYQPIFDVEGKIIPLIFKHTINGKTEELYLSGGNLNKENSSSSEQKKEIISNKINTKYKSEITYKSVITYKSYINYKTKIIDKEKDVKAFDFSFWGFVLWILSLIITLFICPYFKHHLFPQSTLKSFISRVFNGKN